jgi:hypothetical protein
MTGQRGLLNCFAFFPATTQFFDLAVLTLRPSRKPATNGRICALHRLPYGHQLTGEKRPQHVVPAVYWVPAKLIAIKLLNIHMI